MLATTPLPPPGPPPPPTPPPGTIVTSQEPAILKVQKYRSNWDFTVFHMFITQWFINYGIIIASHQLVCLEYIVFSLLDIREHFKKNCILSERVR